MKEIIGIILGVLRKEIVFYLKMVGIIISLAKSS